MRNEDLLESLEKNISIIFAFVGSMKNDRVMKRRDENYWSIYDHIKHLALTQIMLYKRVEKFINEDTPSIVPFLPEEKAALEEDNSKPISVLMRSYEKWRKKQIELIRATEGEIWDKEALHPEYEKYTFEILIRHILLHDSFHMYRMEEIWILRDGFLSDLK
jgi:hypothetical protein